MQCSAWLTSLVDYTAVNSLEDNQMVFVDAPDREEESIELVNSSVESETSNEAERKDILEVVF